LFNDNNAKVFPFLTKVTRENLRFVAPVLCYLWNDTKKNNAWLLDRMSENENDGRRACIKDLENEFYTALFTEPFVAFRPAYLTDEMRDMTGLIAGDRHLKLIAGEVIKIRLNDILTEAAALEDIRTSVLRVKRSSSLSPSWVERTSPRDLELTDLVDQALGTQRSETARHANGCESVTYV